MKPTVVITRFPYESSWGGEESHTIAIAQHLRSKGYEVVFLGSCPILLQKFSELQFPVRKVWGGKMVVTPLELIKSFFLFPLIKWNLARHFKKLAQEVEIKALYCLSLNEKILLTPEALKRSIPVTWVEHQEIRNWLLKNPWRKQYQELSGSVKIVPINQLNKQKLVKGMKVNEASIIDITNGVDVKTIQQIPRKTEPGLIVVANRFIPKKGVMDFLYTLPILFQSRPNIKVVIVGEGEEEKSMKEFIKKNLSEKHIQVNNFLKKENWFELLSRCDVFVSTSRDTNETFSLSTAEALASGCKGVVTNCSGIADDLKDGHDAFLAEPMKPEHLRLQIEKALDADESMREHAKNTAQKKFNLDVMLQHYESVILRT